MAVVHIVHRVNTNKIINVKVVPMEEFIILLSLDAYVMKLLICFGMVKHVYYVNILNIGISVISYVKYVHSNKFMTYLIDNVNIVLHQIHTIMDCIVQYVQTINSIILQPIPVRHAQVVKYMIQWRWFASVQVIIHFRLPMDVYNAIYRTISIQHHDHVSHALKTMSLIQV